MSAQLWRFASTSAVSLARPAEVALWEKPIECAVQQCTVSGRYKFFNDAFLMFARGFWQRARHTSSLWIACVRIASRRAGRFDPSHVRAEPRNTAVEFCLDVPIKLGSFCIHNLTVTRENPNSIVGQEFDDGVRLFLAGSVNYNIGIQASFPESNWEHYLLPLFFFQPESRRL